MEQFGEGEGEKYSFSDRQKESAKKREWKVRERNRKFTRVLSVTVGERGERKLCLRKRREVCVFVNVDSVWILSFFLSLSPLSRPHVMKIPRNTCSEFTLCFGKVAWKKDWRQKDRKKGTTERKKREFLRLKIFEETWDFLSLKFKFNLLLVMLKWWSGVSYRVKENGMENRISNRWWRREKEWIEVNKWQAVITSIVSLLPPSIQFIFFYCLNTTFFLSSFLFFLSFFVSFLSILASFLPFSFFLSLSLSFSLTISLYFLNNTLLSLDVISGKKRVAFLTTKISWCYQSWWSWKEEEERKREKRKEKRKKREWWWLSQERDSIPGLVHFRDQRSCLREGIEPSFSLSFSFSPFYLFLFLSLFLSLSLSFSLNESAITYNNITHMKTMMIIYHQVKNEHIWMNIFSFNSLTLSSPSFLCLPRNMISFSPWIHPYFHLLIFTPFSPPTSLFLTFLPQFFLSIFHSFFSLILFLFLFPQNWGVINIQIL